MSDSTVGIRTGTDDTVHTRTTTPNSKKQQVMVIGVPDAESVAPADATFGLASDVKRDPTTITAVGDGRTTVTTAGTAVQLPNTACKWVTVTALSSNAQQVNVGASTVLAAAGTSRGKPLQPGESYTLAVANLNLLYVDSRVNGEGVAYLYGN